MVKHTMVGRLVYGYFADAFITCSIFEQIAQKICIYQIKVVPLHTVFILEEFRRTPYAVIAWGVLLYIWLKRLYILLKINFFIKKKWKKFCSIKKKQYLCTVKQIKTITTMKKRNIFRTAWAVISLALIAFVCVEWHKQGCGVWSLIAAISFYGVLSTGLLIAVEDVIERR